MAKAPSGTLFGFAPALPGGKGPLFERIRGRLERLILDGALPRGSRLASSRMLAAELGVSRNTILAAIESLVAEGFLETRPGSGTFVAAILPEEPDRRPDAPPQPASAWPSAQPLHPNLPPLDLFPRDLWARLSAQQWQRMRMDDLFYAAPGGHPPLRAAIRDHLRLTRGVECTAEQVVVLPGTLAALDLCARLLLRPGDTVLMEDPGYPQARGALAAAGARVLPVPVGPEGFDIDAAAGAQAAMAFVTPRSQFPLAVAMSPARRAALLDWSRRTGGWIVEDDYDAEYRFGAGRQPTLWAEAGGRQVVHIGSFNTILFPALRIAYAILPPDAARGLAARRALIDGFTATHAQAVLHAFIAEGHFARHVRRVRVATEARRAAVIRAIGTDFAGILTLRGAEAGLHLAVDLSPDFAEESVARQAGRRGIAPRPLGAYAAGPGGGQGLVIGVAGAAPPALSRALRTLGAVLSQRPALRCEGRDLVPPTRPPRCDRPAAEA